MITFLITVSIGVIIVGVIFVLSLVKCASAADQMTEEQYAKEVSQSETTDTKLP